MRAHRHWCQALRVRRSSSYAAALTQHGLGCGIAWRWCFQMKSTTSSGVIAGEVHARFPQSRGSGSQALPGSLARGDQTSGGRGTQYRSAHNAASRDPETSDQPDATWRSLNQGGAQPVTTTGLGRPSAIRCFRDRPDAQAHGKCASAESLKYGGPASHAALG
jgi:hypothetical protein